MSKRRYSRYKREDVWVQMVHLQEKLGITVQHGTTWGNSVTITRHLNEGDREERVVVLAHSHDWYTFSLNCTERFKHGITAIVCGTHDSCIDRPVLALDAMHWYEPKKIRGDFGPLEPKLDAQGKVIPDLFEHKRKSQYGHHMFVGALMQGRVDAWKRLEGMNARSRRRIAAKVRRLHKRRVGRPFAVWPVERNEAPETKPL